MLSNLDRFISFNNKWEGGYTDDRRDSGNWTSSKVGKGTLIGSNSGCGAPAMVRWANTHVLGAPLTASYMKALPQSVKIALAVQNYWTPLRGNALWSGLDIFAIDYAWNRGVNTSIHDLQTALGVTPDGVMGPVTLEAVAEIDDHANFLHELYDVQHDSYTALDNFDIYGAGWIARLEDKLTLCLGLV